MEINILLKQKLFPTYFLTCCGDFYTFKYLFHLIDRLSDHINHKCYSKETIYILVKLG